MNKNLYKVDGYWMVVARNVWEAQRLLGLYMDLPASWFQYLKVEFIGNTSRVRLTGREIQEQTIRQEMAA